MAGVHVAFPRPPPSLLPSLPPASETFIQERRRALRRFLLLIVRHPVLARDDLVKFFLTASGPDVSSRMKEKFRSAPDEFVFNEHAQNAEVRRSRGSSPDVEGNS